MISFKMYLMIHFNSIFKAREIVRNKSCRIPPIEFALRKTSKKKYNKKKKKKMKLSWIKNRLSLCKKSDRENQNEGKYKRIFYVGNNNLVKWLR